MTVFDVEIQGRGVFELACKIGLESGLKVRDSV